jgi:TonB family protein
MRTRRVALILFFAACSLNLAFACGEGTRKNKKTKPDYGGVIGGIDGCKLVPPDPLHAVPDRVRVYERVEREHLISSVPPIYPEAAIKNHVEGKVRLKIVVAKDGTVSKADVLNGPAELTQAAIDAVSKYKFSPFLVNGAPFEVECPMTVPFTLKKL